MRLRVYLVVQQQTSSNMGILAFLVLELLVIWNIMIFFIPQQSQRTVSSLLEMHQFDEALQEAIILTAMTDAPATWKWYGNDIVQQAKARPIKKELIKEKSLEMVLEEYIDTAYYYQIYFLPACWKSYWKVVARKLKKLTSEAIKHSALKENITVWVKGLSWKWCWYAWSKDGKNYSVQELAQPAIEKSKVNFSTF